MLRAAAGAAVLFGLLTVLSGGLVLFGGEEPLRLAGKIVRFVLLFNLLAGFVYVVAGVGLLRRKRWACWLAAAILLGTATVSVAFGLHVLQGGAFEMRTVLALTFRTAVWAIITWIALKTMGTEWAVPAFHPSHCVSKQNETGGKIRRPFDCNFPVEPNP